MFSGKTDESTQKEPSLLCRKNHPAHPAYPTRKIFYFQCGMSGIGGIKSGYDKYTRARVKTLLFFAMTLLLKITTLLIFVTTLLIFATTVLMKKERLLAQPLPILLLLFEVSDVLIQRRMC